jgi:hypothetical protein
LPLIVVVALGEPSVPVTSWAWANDGAMVVTDKAPLSKMQILNFMVRVFLASNL